MSRHERVRLALLVGAFSVLMGLGGAALVTVGGAGLEVFGFVLIAFAAAGLVQAGGIGLGHMTPGAARDREDRDARRR